MEDRNYGETRREEGTKQEQGRRGGRTPGRTRELGPRPARYCAKAERGQSSEGSGRCTCDSPACAGGPGGGQGAARG